MPPSCTAECHVACYTEAIPKQRGRANRPPPNRRAAEAESIGRWIADLGTWLLPRIGWVRGLGKAMIREVQVGQWYWPVLVTAGLIVALYALSIVAFRRRDY